jgi:hypothetical protein
MSRSQRPPKKKKKKSTGKGREPRGPRNQCARRLTVAAKLLAAGIAAVQWVTSTRVSWPAGSIAETLLSVVAAGILGFHLTNTHTRIELGHWDAKSLKRVLLDELAVGCGMPVAVLTILLVCSPTWETLLLIGVMFLVSEIVYEPIEEEIRLIVSSEPGLEHGTSRFANRRPFKFLGIDRSIGQMADGMHRPGLQRALGFWVKPPWSPSLSRTRTVILYAMLVSTFVAFTAAADVGLQQIAVEDPPAEETANPGTTQPPSSPGEGAGQNHDLAGTSESEWQCPHPPSFGAPAWARSDLDALYYGTKDLNATAPPGNDVGGCTGTAIVPVAEHGAFVYTIGRNELGEIRSIAVDSLEFGPAIFLSPAAQRVLALIEDGLTPLGGYPTMQVAGSDAVAIITERGTFTLVRGAKHLPGSPELAMPYVELPPTATTAWVGAMHEQGDWLWPLHPRPTGEGREYPLAVDRTSTNPPIVVSYDAGEGTAQRDQYSYYLPEPQIGQRELEAYARTAR